MRFDIRPASIGAVTGLTITAGVKSYQIRWTHTTASVAIWASKIDDRETATQVATVAGDAYTHVTDGSQYFFWLQTLDSRLRHVGGWNPSTRVGGLTAPPSTVGRIHIAASAAQWSIGPTGLPVNTVIGLTANLLGGIEGFVTWSRSGAGTLPPTAGTTNVWQVYAVDQTDDATAYTASLTWGGVTYTDSITLHKVKDGAKGEKGDTGQVGSLTGYGKAYGIVSTSWSDSIANRVISNMLLGESLTTALTTTYHLMPGDTVTLSDQSSFAETRFWDGTSWIAAGTIINGNLLVKGTVAADALTAGAITTGYNANARINIGNTTFIGSITSPLHVSKVSAQPSQALISAQNTKDDSVAIWGSSTYARGNAIAGTWHASAADAAAGKWKSLGALGSDMGNAAVYGAVYNDPAKFAGNFECFTTDSDSGSPVVSASVKLATTSALGFSYAMVATGPVQFFGPSSPLVVSGTAGAAGQVLTSQGPSNSPTWADAPGAGSVTYSSIKTCFAGTTGSVLDLNSTFRVTGTNVPTSGSGLESAFYGSEGFLVSCTRNSSGAVSSYLPLQFQGSSITLNVAPTFPTASTADKSTKGATTAFVKNQGYITSSGSITGSSGSCTGNAATATTAENVGGYKCLGGSGSCDGSGNFTVSFPSSFSSSTSFGADATSTSGNYAVITSASASSVTFQVQSRATGAAVAGAGIRWTAIGT